jgi:hypothetical protein
LADRPVRSSLDDIVISVDAAGAGTCEMIRAVAAD